MIEEISEVKKAVGHKIDLHSMQYKNNNIDLLIEDLVRAKEMGYTCFDLWNEGGFRDDQYESYLRLHGRIKPKKVKK